MLILLFLYVPPAVNRYASCESNKAKLVRRGVLPLFVQLMRSDDSSDEERMLGAKGIWLLAFAEENRAVIQQDAECLQGKCIKCCPEVLSQVSYQNIWFQFILSVWCIEMNMILAASGTHIYTLHLP